MRVGVDVGGTFTKAVAVELTTREIVATSVVPTTHTAEGGVAAGVVDAWLFDSGAGSGKIFDWRAAKAQLGESHGKFIVAGGLTPENVEEAIAVFHPWGVDVVTGVERDPGRKDFDKLKAFVAAVRRAEKR